MSILTSCFLGLTFFVASHKVAQLLSRAKASEGWSIYNPNVGKYLKRPRI